MTPERSYLVCATPRSGSTLVCQALKGTGVAGRPEEYFEALLHSGRPRRPEEYFIGVDDKSILDHLGERGVGDDPQPRSPLWSRAAYDRYLEWAMETGTTPNGVFGAKLMWGYFGDFVSLLRNIPAYRELPLGELLPAAFPNLTFVRVVRANKIRQAVSLWKAVQTATWRQQDASQGISVSGLGDESDHPPYKSFIQDHRPQLRFHYGAISHLLQQLLVEEASWDAFFEHSGIKPVLVLYENFAADYENATLNVLEPPRARAATGLQPRAADEKAVGRHQRRLGAPLLRAAPRAPSSTSSRLPRRRGDPRSPARAGRTCPLSGGAATAARGHRLRPPDPPTGLGLALLERPGPRSVRSPQRGVAVAAKRLVPGGLATAPVGNLREALSAEFDHRYSYRQRTGGP